jgi:hypothetical protein
MEKVKTIRFTLLVLLFTQVRVYAQQAEIIRPGLIRAQITISPSYMFGDKHTYFYLHGNLEGFLNKKLSVVGETYYYLGDQTSNNSKYEYNHAVFFGFSRHFTKKNNDLYIGLQPGVSLTKLNANENNLTSTSIGINPLFSTVVGYNFFVNRIFHFFVQTRFITGEHNYDIHQSLTELRFSAGLGFNLNMLKAK